MPLELWVTWSIRMPLNKFLFLPCQLHVKILFSSYHRHHIPHWDRKLTCPLFNSQNALWACSLLLSPLPLLSFSTLPALLSMTVRWEEDGLVAMQTAKRWLRHASGDRLLQQQCLGQHLQPVTVRRQKDSPALLARSEYLPNEMIRFHSCQAGSSGSRLRPCSHHYGGQSNRQTWPPWFL
jgi:hypothetical protein